MSITSAPSRPADSDRARLVLTDGRRALRLRRVRPWHRALARLRTGSLDHALAAGADPDADVLLALRAARLGSRAERAYLADAWDGLLRRAAEPPTPAVRVPIAARGLVAVGGDVRELAALLRAPGPVAIRGVAAASQLLTRGDGPIYRPGTGAGQLAVAVRAVIERLRIGPIPD